MCSFSRRIAVPVISLDPNDPPLTLTELPDTVPVPFQGACRTVRLAHSVFTHIVERRLHDGDEQVSLVLRRMQEVLANPTHWGRLTPDPRRVELYSRVSWDDPAGVLVSIKFVHASETWVNTAHPMGVSTLRKHVEKGRLLLFPSK